MKLSIRNPLAEEYGGFGGEDGKASINCYTQAVPNDSCDVQSPPGLQGFCAPMFRIIFLLTL